MTAQERLGRLYHLTLNGEQDGYAEEACDCTDYADAMLAADPTLAQDIADGQALRLLREALERRAYNAMLTFRDGDIWYVDVTDPAGPEVDSDSHVLTVDGPTIAEAADACRTALEASRG